MSPFILGEIKRNHSHLLVIVIPSFLKKQENHRRFFTASKKEIAMNKFIYNILAFILKVFCKKEPIPYEKSKYVKPTAQKSTASEPAVAADAPQASDDHVAEAEQPAEAEAAPANVSDGEASEKPDKKKKMLVVFGICAVVMALTLIIPKVINGRPIKVDLSSVVALESQTGINGRGEVVFVVDESKLKAALFPKSTTATAEEMEALTQAVAECIDITFPGRLAPGDMNDGDMRLKNGDVITVSVGMFPEDMNQFSSYQFHNGSFPYEVKGLMEGELVQPFSPDAIEVRVEGNDGMGQAFLTKKLTGSYSYYLNYDWAPKTGLSNGDVVTVTIAPDTDKLAELHYAIGPERSFEYVVSGLDAYVSDPADIPPQLINSMVNYAEAELTSDFHAVPMDDLDQVVTTPEITSIYFFDKADKTNPYSDYFTGLYMNNCVMVLGHFFVQDIEEVAIEPTEGDARGGTHPEVARTFGGYYAWIFPDVVKKEDGSITYNREMIKKRSTSFQTESDFLADTKSMLRDFATTQIGSVSGQGGT